MDHQNVRVVSDKDCERIHKEKKIQREKFLFYFPKRGKRARYGDMHQPVTKMF